MKPEFAGTLDELVDVTEQRINNSLKLLWAITQQQKVEPKVEASIESVPSFCDAASNCADICIVLTRKGKIQSIFLVLPYPPRPRTLAGFVRSQACQWREVVRKVV